MSSFSTRHTEFFGPDYARGPFGGSRIEVTALQIAAAIAQLRAPLLRSDDEIRAHAEFIQALAERLAPDFASAVTMDVGNEISNTIQTSIRTNVPSYSLLHCWLADTPGGGVTTTTPTAVTWNTGVVLAEIETRKRYMIITPATGVADVSVQFGSARTWYWAASRNGRVFFSSQLAFS